MERDAADPSAALVPGVLSVNLANVSLLQNLAVAGLTNGETRYVETLRSYFVLDKASDTAADAITVVTAKVPTGTKGRWLRQPIAHPSWLRQATWFVSSGVNLAAGNDENDGSTAATALKTHAELSRRWGADSSTLVGADTTLAVDTSINPPPLPSVIKVIKVTLMDDLPRTDPINLKVTLGPNTLLAYVGTPKAGGAGMLAVVATKDPASNTPWTVSLTPDPATKFKVEVGQRLRVMKGDGKDHVAWIAKFLPDKSIRMSNFVKPLWAQDPEMFVDPRLSYDHPKLGGGVIPAHFNEPYVVETLTQATVGSIVVDGPLAGDPNTPLIGFKDIDFRHQGKPSAAATDRKLQIQSGVKGIRAVFWECSWDGTLNLVADGIRHWYLNCKFQHLALTRVGPLFRAGITLGEISYRGGIAVFDDDFMSQGGVGFRIQGSGILFGSVCAFDSSEAGVHLGLTSAWPCSAACMNLLEASKQHRIWGANNAKGGVGVSGGSVLIYESNPPTITGMTPELDDFLLAGSSSSRAFDESLGLPTSKRANSWKNLALPIPAGGFDMNAHNFERNAHIVLRT
jgi:hypothetical protein